MRVAFFLGSLNRGGTETLLLDTFRWQKDNLFDCILLYRNEGSLSNDFRSTGVRMIRSKPRGLKLSYIFQLRTIIKREGVDILHTQTLLNAFLGLFCVCFSRVKMVASFHGFRSSFMDKLLIHFVMWFADACVFVSRFEQNWYSNHSLFIPKSRCHVIYNGVDFSKFEEKYPIPSFLEKDDDLSPQKTIRLLMVGSFVGGRSHLFLCKCMRKLRDKGFSNVKLYFVGKRSMAEPEGYDECIEFCEKNGMQDCVLFLGERNDVPAILMGIDGFFYSTNHDTFGIAVVEAMSVGVPVFVNDWEVMKEITCNGEYAWLYRTQEVDDCVEKMEAFINNTNKYKEKAKSNAAKIKEMYSIERHVRCLYLLYNSVLNT